MFDLYTEIFDRGAEQRMARLAERDAIWRAQQGDEDAVVALCLAYAPALRNAASKHTARLGADEARQTAVTGLMEAIYAFDLDEYEGQLAGIVVQYVSAALRDNSTDAVAVPEWQRRRFFGILKRAGGDVDKAAEMAPLYEMRVETFHALRVALCADRLSELPAYVADSATPIWGKDQPSAFDDFEAYTLAHTALGAVEGLERKVVRYAYAFENGEPMSDGEVAEAINRDTLGEQRTAAGESVLSRKKAQRTRVSALALMGERLGLEA